MLMRKPSEMVIEHPCQESEAKPVEFMITQSIKFSTDVGYPVSLDMRVYLWKDEMEDSDPVMTVEYKTKDWNSDYDIVHDSEMYELYVDGELVE